MPRWLLHRPRLHGGGFANVDYYLGRPVDWIRILDTNTEHSTQLLGVDGPSATPWPIHVSGGRFDSAFVPRIAADGKPDDRIVWNLSAGPMTIEHLTINTADWNGIDDIGKVHERYRHRYTEVRSPASNQRRWMIDPAKDKDHRIAIRPIRI